MLSKKLFNSFISFIAPHKLTILVFLLLLVFLPVFYSYSEPERTNYLPGEEQVWIRKSKIYTSVFDEFFFHTEGHIDVLLGIIVRNYIDNDFGFVLLAGYYLISCFINWIFKKLIIKKKK